MSYRLLLKHRAFFRALNRELKFAQVGCLAVKVQIVAEEPPLLQIDTFGLSKLPVQDWWSEYLNTGQIPVPLAQPPRQFTNSFLRLRHPKFAKNTLLTQTVANVPGTD